MSINPESIVKEIGKGDRVALTKFAIDHYEKTNRPLRVAIDAAIWNFQNAASQGGRHPALRTLFFRLLKILALPIHPVFVYDGPKRPLTKRGKTVSRYGTCIENETAKQLLSLFRFPFHTAPGEAEAECALLQKHNVVDAVMSQDIDAVMFGSAVTLRDWSKEGTRGNKTPTHVFVIDAEKVKSRSGLDSEAMILVALLSGGDYDKGLEGFGPSLACEIAKAGFGADLLRLIREQDEMGLKEWRERLSYELESNESGYFRHRHLKIKIPESFPDMTILKHYTHPNTTKLEDLSKLQSRWMKEWAAEIDIPLLRQYTASTFDWTWKSGARRFVRCIAQPLFQDRLRRGVVQQSLFRADSITEDRKHFVSGGILELRFKAVPADIVGIDLEAEDDNPNALGSQMNRRDSDEEQEGNGENSIAGVSSQAVEPSSPSKRRAAPWDPYTTEKWWIPATLLKIGLGALVEEWEQQQRDMLLDPKKFATRKCTKKPQVAIQIDASMKPDAIRTFLVPTVPGTNGEKYLSTDAVQLEKCWSPELTTSEVMPRTPSKRHHEAIVRVSSPSITRFFKPQKNMSSDTGHADAPIGNIKEDLFDKPLMASSAVRAIRQQNRPPQHVNHAARPTLQDHSISNGSTASIKQFSTTTKPGIKVSKKFSNDSSSTEQRRAAGKLPSKRERKQPTAVEAAIDATSTLLSGADPGAVKLQSRQRTRRDIANKPSKINAVPRDSLPGTWKDLTIEDHSARRPPRVSYVDLTGDD